jgi:hypothetical protein
VKLEPIEILSEYQHRVDALREQKVTTKEMQVLSMTDLLYLKAVIHPTNKQASKDITRELVKFIYDQGIVTAEEIYTKFGWSDKAVMRRLKLLKEFSIIRRESKKYYLGTPRLEELRIKYLDRVCN